MMIARWHMQARFGHKQKAMDMMMRWDREIGPKAGVPSGSQRILSGSVGVREAEIQVEMRVDSLGGLNDFFERLGKVPEHAAWGKDLEPYIVSGSTYWEVFRVVDPS